MRQYVSQGTDRTAFFRRWRTMRQNLTTIFTSVFPVAIVDRDYPEQEQNLWGFSFCHTAWVDELSGRTLGYESIVILPPPAKDLIIRRLDCWCGFRGPLAGDETVAEVEAKFYSYCAAGGRYPNFFGAAMMLWTPLYPHNPVLHHSYEVLRGAVAGLNLANPSYTPESRFFGGMVDTCQTVDGLANVRIGIVKKIVPDPQGNPAGGGTYRDSYRPMSFVKEDQPPLRVPPDRVLAITLLNHTLGLRRTAATGGSDVEWVVLWASGLLSEVEPTCLAP